MIRATMELVAVNGQHRVRIARRDDGLFVVWEDVLRHDPDEAATYWSKPMHPLTGIYESMDAALSEVRTWPAYRSVD